LRHLVLFLVYLLSGIQLAKMLGASKYLEINATHMSDDVERARLYAVMKSEFGTDTMHQRASPEIGITISSCEIRRFLLARLYVGLCC
jgi:hypothetical protein